MTEESIKNNKNALKSKKLTKDWSSRSKTTLKTSENGPLGALPRVLGWPPECEKRMFFIDNIRSSACR
jgi:hypothetical protein